MDRKKRHWDIRTRLTVWFLVVALVPLVIVCAVIYFQRAEAIRQEAFNKLIAIRDLKADVVNHWLDERTGDFDTISSIDEVRKVERISNKSGRELETDPLAVHIWNILDQYVKNYKYYKELSILDPATGKVVISTDRGSHGEDHSREPYFRDQLKRRSLYISEIYYSNKLKRPTMAFSSPIWSWEHKGGERIAGILVAWIDLDNSIYNILQERTGMGETGETLIVNRDVVALSELRWYENAPLHLEITAEPSINAAAGKTGIIETADYRGEPVLAAYTHINRSHWGFVSKQDLAELYAPINKMLEQIVLLLVGSIVGIYFVAGFFARTLSRPLRHMVEVSKRLTEGDMSARNRSELQNDIGFLAGSIDRMADSLVSKVNVQKTSAGIIDAIVAAKGPGEFARVLVNKLVEATGAVQGGFYLLGSDGVTLEPTATIGSSGAALEPFNMNSFEGEFGRALASEKITRVREIPEDTIFKFKTTAGVAAPSEIITIPLVLDDKTVAVVSLVSLKAFTDESVEMLEQTWVGMGTSLWNVLSGEATRSLADELAVKNEELNVQQAELAQTSVELQKQNVDLELQRRKVEEASRLKSEFLSNMSHEFRTPLNSILILSHMLIKEASERLTPDEVKYLEIVERNGKSLLDLINDILDLSRIEAGKVDLDVYSFSFYELLDELLEGLGPIAAGKGLELIKEVPKGLPRLKTDGSRVRQILKNLLGNALKFTGEGSVKVSAVSEGDRLIVRVEDTGIGISKEGQAFIFDEFRQVDGRSSRKYQGTGLGLSIAIKAAKMIKGELSVESTPDKGSVFTLSMPITIEESVYEQRASLPEFRPGARTVLVVDDERDTADSIAEYLSVEGFNTITAASGREALKLAEQYQPFAITLDIIMPGMDGFEVLAKLKENPKTADIPVIIVSVSDEKKTGIALGALGHITKPVDAEQLIGEIRKLVQKPHCIMVVDDNEVDRMGMARAIETEKLEVTAVEDGKRCMELLRGELPDVLVLDLIMPGLDGFEVLSRVRSSQRTRNLPVIIVTAKDLDREEKRRLNAAAVSVIEKSDLIYGELMVEIKRLLLLVDSEASATAPAATAEIRILLVEDNEVSITQVKSFLESEGFIVDVARDGAEAMETVNKVVPDGIILDIMMPGMDGLDLLDRIRGFVSTRAVPVLILTAKDLTNKELKRLRANNVQQFVQKGDIDRERLLEKIKGLIGIKARPALKAAAAKKKKPAAPRSKTKKRLAKPRSEGAAATLLIVEDNPDNMLSVKAILGDGFKVLEAVDGVQGLEMVRKHRPDLVLLDMALPKMDGFKVISEIRKDAQIAEITVIAMTALAMKGDREEILNAGCDGYISKPVDMDSLLNMIRNFLS